MYIFIILSALGTSLGGSGCDLAGGYHLSPNSSGTVWKFLMLLTWLVVSSRRIVYVNFHSPICPRKFFMTAEISAY